MQLRLPWTETGAGQAAPIVFVRHRRARRYILRVLPDGTIRVTLPRWGAKRAAQAFVDASQAWIARQRARPRVRPPAVQAWHDGTRVLIDGREAIVGVERGSDHVRISCDGAVVATLRKADVDVRVIVETWLRARAARELPPLLLTLAATSGIGVAKVSVRNQRSRWGACSPTGTITLNWRLIQTPPFVREYVLLHELMHRREMNHSRRFWRLVAACCPRHADARQWLRQEGKLVIG